ncbi:hypothetical protein QVD17_19721 [Tagetes erecta]|uniref:Uncharacterized protein n=1 Tax=Tagetes erecta TaxID=13708 RepID=A0AAD8KQ85_TARER|nr:hypothetical protein QVD17_19721 [Tagetes erecta]
MFVSARPPIGTDSTAKTTGRANLDAIQARPRITSTFYEIKTAERKVLFDTERLSGRTWAVGQWKRVRGQYGRLVRSAKLSFSVPSPMWSALLPVCLLSLDGISH